MPYHHGQYLHDTPTKLSQCCDLVLVSGTNFLYFTVPNNVGLFHDENVWKVAVMLR